MDIIVEHSCDDGDAPLLVQLFYGVFLEYGFYPASPGDDYDDVMADLRPYGCEIGDYGHDGLGHFVYIDGTHNFGSHGEELLLGVTPPGRDWDERLRAWQRRVDMTPEDGRWTLLIAEEQESYKV